MSEFIGKLRAAFDNLSSRERILVSVVGALFVVVLLYFGVWRQTVSYRERAEARLASADAQLGAMTRLRGEYDEVNRRLSSVEARIRSGPRGNLRTTLENLARESAVKVESMEPQASPANDRYRETKVEVGLRGVTLAQTVGYLHKIESTQQLLSVKSLRIRTRSDTPELLDVTFTVSSFEPI